MILKEVWTKKGMSTQIKFAYSYVLNPCYKLEKTCEMDQRYLDEAKEKYRQEGYEQEVEARR